jgi:hypothetical protein
MATQNAVAAADTEDLFKEDVPDDLTSVITSPGFNVFKTAAFVFILFILVSSDVFVDKILATDTNTYAEGRHPTTQGTFIQGTIVALGYIVIHSLITAEYL